MKNTILPVYLPNSYTYEILGNFKIEIVIVNNVYQIPIDALFLMAARKNAKRGFLFVSKVVGKHIPVHPLIPLLASGALAGRYASIMYQEKTFEEYCDFSAALTHGTGMAGTWEYIRQHPLPLPAKTLFIGFAETATALGHGVFSCFAENAKYIHTTRENVLGIADILNFTEEHSHAMEHYCYALEPGLFANEDMVVLIDDEITTGKSVLNFIRAIQSRHPRKKYAVVSLLDWRSQQDKQRYVEVEKELDITIHTISLLSGKIAITGEPISDYEVPQDTCVENNKVEPVLEMLVIDESAGRLQFFSSFNTQGEKNTVPYLQATGRFGVTSQEQAAAEDWYQEVGVFLKAKRRGSHTLCLGTGEFMYIPFRIASYMGEGIKVQSTTRSPIYAVDKEHYAVRQLISFSNVEDGFITNYLYNIPPNHYDEIFIFLEREVDRSRLAPLLHALAPLGIASIYVVACVGRVRSRPVILPPPTDG